MAHDVGESGPSIFAKENDLLKEFCSVFGGFRLTDFALPTFKRTLYNEMLGKRATNSISYLDMQEVVRCYISYGKELVELGRQKKNDQSVANGLAILFFVAERLFANAMPVNIAKKIDSNILVNKNYPIYLDFDSGREEARKILSDIEDSSDNTMFSAMAGLLLFLFSKIELNEYITQASNKSFLGNCLDKISPFTPSVTGCVFSDQKALDRLRRIFGLLNSENQEDKEGFSLFVKWILAPEARHNAKLSELQFEHLQKNAAEYYIDTVNLMVKSWFSMLRSRESSYFEAISGISKIISSSYLRTYLLTKTNLVRRVSSEQQCSKEELLATGISNSNSRGKLKVVTS